MKYRLRWRTTPTLANVRCMCVGLKRGFRVYDDDITTSITTLFFVNPLGTNFLDSRNFAFVLCTPGNIRTA